MRKRLAALLLTLLATAAVSPAYYHFLHFSSRNGSIGLPEKFDLNALRNKTVSYFIADSAGLQFSGNDSYLGMVSQIRLAAKTWNEVETSDLRLAYGGILTPSATSASPTLEISFDEQPPGIVAIGGPVVRAASNGTFIPIFKSVIIVRPDLTRNPSYGESFFGTIVHEMGHALGLQHTFTSSVMSTSRTRATTKAHPLAADDIAGISALYPKVGFSASTGSISGRVTLSNTGVNLASVVAISPNGLAVSTLSNPDGSYRIEGLPPRQYLIYVHPLPPALSGQATPGDIAYPVDTANNPIGPSAPFDTLFYPGTPNPSAAFPLSVQAGQTVSSINFSVRQRNAITLHTVSTYAFPGNIAVQPPYLNLDPRMTPRVVASGFGLVTGTAPTPGLAVNILGGSALGLRPYAPSPTGFLQLDLDIRSFSFSGNSPRHLIFTSNGETYVLPSGFILTEQMPPSLTGVFPAVDGQARLAVLSGVNLSANTRILFDGVPAGIRGFDEASGRLTVVPPTAPSGHRANVVAINQDGQSSLFLQDTPQLYPYTDPTPAGNLSVSPNSLPAGIETSVQIDSPGANFIDGQTTVAFGTSDIVVRQLFVISPTKLLVNVSVSPLAQPGSSNLTVVSGLQVTTQPFGFVLQPYNSRATWLNPVVLNQANGQPVISAGSNALLTIANSTLPPTLSTLVYLNDKTLPVLAVAANQIRVQIPPGTQPGVATLRVENGSDLSYPIAIAIGQPPPQIVAVSSASAPIADSTRPVRTNELITLMVNGLESSGMIVDPSRVTVSIGGLNLQPGFVGEQGGQYRVTLTLPSGTPVGVLNLTIALDGRQSDPFLLAVAN